MTFQVNVGLAIAGAFTFPLCHLICRRFVTARWPHLTYAMGFRVSTRMVSALQASMATVVSLRTILICKDIMKDSDLILQCYVWFGWSYFVYDVVVMYLGYSYLEKERGVDQPRMECMKKFMSRECLIVLHHFISFAVGFPVIAFLRRGIGDFFVACIIFAEFSTPFFSIRGIQKEMQWKEGPFWTLNGLVFVITFFIGRVLTVPYMYWTYANYKKIPLLKVPFQIPLKCNIGSFLFLWLQLYWFNLLVKGTISFIRGSLTGTDEATSNTKDRLSNGCFKLDDVARDKVDHYLNNLQNWQNAANHKED